jgi:hypothetical protein
VRLPPFYDINEQGNSMHSVVTRPLDFFRPDPDQVRKDFPEPELHLLGASLVKRQLVPLVWTANAARGVQGCRQ